MCGGGGFPHHSRCLLANLLPSLKDFNMSMAVRIPRKTRGFINQGSPLNPETLKALNPETLKALNPETLKALN